MSRVVAVPATDSYLYISTLFGLHTTLLGSTIAMTRACTALLLGIDLDGHCDFSHLDNKVPVQRRFHPIRTDMRLIVLQQGLEYRD